MTGILRREAAAAACFLSLAAAYASSPQAPAAATTSVAQVSFQFERPGLAVPKFTLTVDERGSAHYEADEVVAAQGGADAEPLPTHHLERTVTLSRQTTERIFVAARAMDRFNIACAAKAKNIADTGTKTLRYTGEGGDGSCTYNYSQDKRVVALTELFEGIARTLELGRKLDFQHRFDRLGLDASTATLVEEVDGGRAMEVGVIAPTLRSLAEDAEILQRVRERAARLLQLAQAPL